MKFRWDNRYLHWGVTAFLVIAASMLFYYGIFHMKTLIVGIKTFLGIMAPIIYGVILAYILSPLINLFEQKLIYPQLEKHCAWYQELLSQPAFTTQNIQERIKQSVAEK